MFAEFKKFIARGNVFDMAVGIIIGAAFTAIVKSMVDDIVMPIVGLFSGNVDFSNKFITLGEGSFATLAAAQEAGVPTLNYGLFLNALLTFLIVSFVVFLLVKGVNELKERTMKEDKKEEAKAAPAADIVLLGEIRELLKKKK